MNPSASCSKRTLAATLLTALLLLFALELHSPYYFLQDDSLEYYLPEYVHNWRSLINGELPLYNFHTFGGLPHASMGQTAVFYLPQYLALSLSQSIWGHPFAAIDLMAIMHALLAVAGGYALLRHLGVRDTAAAFGALTALSAFFLWCGQMWITATMLCAWFPWMTWASLSYIAKPSTARAGWVIFFRLALLYGGHSQFFILAIFFEHLFALSYSLATRRGGWLFQYARYAALNIPTVLLGLPFFLPLSAEMGRSLLRSQPLPYEVFSSNSIDSLRWVFGQLFVFIQLRMPRDIIPSSLPFLSHIGLVPTLLSFGAYALWRKQSKSSPLIAASAICFFLALLWAWNLLSPLIYHVPIFNRFRWPFKVVYFAGFFQCILAGLVLERWSKRWQRIALAGFLLNWLLVFCVLPDHAWRMREYHPPLQSHWQEKLKDGRYFVISPTPVYSAFHEFAESNYSVLWELDNLLGYEPMLSRLGGQVAFIRSMMAPDLHSGTYYGPADQPLLAHLKQWSVKYVLVNPDRADVAGNLTVAGYQKQETERGWTLWKDPNALSRVRWSDMPADSSAGICWTPHVNSIDISLSQWPSRHLVLAFTANPGLQTCIENRCTPVGNSPDGLIHIDVPAGTRDARLVYHNGLLLRAISISLATLVAFALLWLYRQSGKRRVSRTCLRELTQLQPHLWPDACFERDDDSTPMTPEFDSYTPANQNLLHDPIRTILDQRTGGAGQ